MLAGELKLATAVPHARADRRTGPGPRQAGGAEAYTLTSGTAASASPGRTSRGRLLRHPHPQAGGALRRYGPRGRRRDRPDRPQRGLKIDIARKHFTAGWIEDRLREMADLKLNQLGLHFSDDQGFRIESDTHPEIVSRSTSPRPRSGGSSRSPPRCTSRSCPRSTRPAIWARCIAAHPSSSCATSGGPRRRGVDIANPASARIVDELLREYAALFPGRYWHLGADEYLALIVENPEASFPQLAAAGKRSTAPGTVQDLATGWLNDRAAVARPLGRSPRPGTTASSAAGHHTRQGHRGRVLDRPELAPGRRWSICARAGTS